MKRVRGKRTLLNPPGYQSTAAIVAEVEDTRSWPDGIGSEGAELKASSGSWSIEPDTKLDISDCSRTISLYVEWETPFERRAALWKVDKMVEALTEFREALVEEQKFYAKRQAHIKRLKAAAEKPA